MKEYSSLAVTNFVPHDQLRSRRLFKYDLVRSPTAINRSFRILSELIVFNKENFVGC